MWLTRRRVGLGSSVPLFSTEMRKIGNNYKWMHDARATWRPRPNEPKQILISIIDLYTDVLWVQQKWVRMPVEEIEKPKDCRNDQPFDIASNH
jgi:hypothetical protein